LTILKKIIFIYFIIVSLLSGCSEEVLLTSHFELPQGTQVSYRTDISVSYPHSGLYFELSGVPMSKKDRDFSDFINITLIAENGQMHMPEKTMDINGQRRDVVAYCNNIPKGIRIKQVKIKALQKIQGNKIRWWTGHLK
jgi:hypothetical protein